MGFVRFTLDRRSTSTSSTTEEPKKNQCQSLKDDVDGVLESDRTFDMSLSDRTFDMSLSDRTYDINIEDVYDDDSSHSSSLDGCQHPDPQVENTKARVSFRDEELGLKPCHLVTNYYWRPRTTDEEKGTLYYNEQDFAKFKQEQMYIQHMIEMRNRMKEHMTIMSSGQKEEGQADVNDVVGTTLRDDFLDESIRPRRRSKCSTVSKSLQVHLATDSIDVSNAHVIDS